MTDTKQPKKIAKKPRGKGKAISFRPLPEVAALLERARRKFGERFVTQLIEESCVVHLQELILTKERDSEKVRVLLKKGRSRFA